MPCECIDEVMCDDCLEAEATYWRWYFGPNPRNFGNPDTGHLLECGCGECRESQAVARGLK